MNKQNNKAFELYRVWCKQEAEAGLTVEAFIKEVCNGTLKLTAEGWKKVSRELERLTAAEKETYNARRELNDALVSWSDKANDVHKKLRAFKSAVRIRFSRNGVETSSEKKAGGKKATRHEKTVEPAEEREEIKTSEKPNFNSLAGIMSAMIKGGAKPEDVKKDIFRAWAIACPEHSFYEVK